MIRGEDVGLRPVLEQDLPMIAQWQDNQLTCPMFYSLALMPEAGLRNWLRALLADPLRMRFMVQPVNSESTVGIVGLEHIDYRNQSAELAGLIISPPERSRGWGTKAMTTLIHYAFGDLNLHRLSAQIHGSNHAAVRAAEKAGLVSEGIARQCEYHNGAYEDVIYLSVLREEWKHEHSIDPAIR